MSIVNPLILLGIISISILSKLIPAYFYWKKELGSKSILLGLLLSIKFSTGIVVLSILDNKNLISKELYNTLLSSNILFLFLPFIISPLLGRFTVPLNFKNLGPHLEKEFVEKEAKN
jgi:Kef-type K+ transport system membrane component KefB